MNVNGFPQVKSSSPVYIVKMCVWKSLSELRETFLLVPFNLSQKMFTVKPI